MTRPPFRRQVIAATLVVALLAGSDAAGQASLVPRERTSLVVIASAIDEASRRFGIPAPWLWQIIQVESGGNPIAVSTAGAIGLMQVMPQTYAALRVRHGLGRNPFATRDNVLAGSAYLRALFDRYGAVGMLAAYNAGPARWDAFLRSGRPLPVETRRYVARLLPTVTAAIMDSRDASAAVVTRTPYGVSMFVSRTATDGFAPPKNDRADSGAITIDRPHDDPPIADRDATDVQTLAGRTMSRAPDLRSFTSRRESIFVARTASD